MPARPRYLNVFQIRLPVTGWVSFLHRISGLMLFLLLPVILAGLDTALSGESGFDAVHAATSSWIARTAGFLVAWAVFHHLLAGIRHLLMDTGLGLSRVHATASAQSVLVATLVLLVLYGVVGW